MIENRKFTDINIEFKEIVYIDYLIRSTKKVKSR